MLVSFFLLLKLKNHQPLFELKVFLIIIIGGLVFSSSARNPFAGFYGYLIYNLKRGGHNFESVPT